MTGLRKGQAETLRNQPNYAYVAVEHDIDPKDLLGKKKSIPYNHFLRVIFFLLVSLLIVLKTTVKHCEGPLVRRDHDVRLKARV